MGASPEHDKVLHKALCQTLNGFEAHYPKVGWPGSGPGGATTSVANDNEDNMVMSLDFEATECDNTYPNPSLHNRKANGHKGVVTCWQGLVDLALPEQVRSVGIGTGWTGLNLWSAGD